MHSRLIPIKYHHTNKRRQQYWLYQCECGNEKVISKSDVTNKRTLSCGCLRLELFLNSVKIHGESKGNKTKEYRCWIAIKTRCFNKKNENYPDYGGRGITMYKSWIHSYVIFRDYLLSTIGRAPSSDYSLDRIDVNKNYEPGNLQWATDKEQANNRRRKICVSAEEEKLIMAFRDKKEKFIDVDFQKSYIELLDFKPEPQQPTDADIKK